MSNKLLLERWGLMAGLGFYPPVEEGEEESDDALFEQRLREAIRNGIKQELAQLNENEEKPKRQRSKLAQHRSMEKSNSLKRAKKQAERARKSDAALRSLADRYRRQGQVDGLTGAEVSAIKKILGPERFERMKGLGEADEKGCLVGEHPDEIDPKEEVWEGGDNLEMPAVWMKILGIKDGDKE